MQLLHSQSLYTKNLESPTSPVEIPQLLCELGIIYVLDPLFLASTTGNLIDQKLESYDLHT